jgi:hypothetical protein
MDTLLPQAWVVAAAVAEETFKRQLIAPADFLDSRHC